MKNPAEDAFGKAIGRRREADSAKKRDTERWAGRSLFGGARHFRFLRNTRTPAFCNGVVGIWPSYRRMVGDRQREFIRAERAFRGNASHSFFMIF